MSICIKDQIQNMNIVIGCTVGCTYCYARNNVKRWHMIDDFADPEFFPGKLKMMEKKRPQNFLLTGMSDLSGWKPEWRDEVFAKIRENPQHQFLFLTKRPDLLDFDTDLENAWFGVTVTRKAELWRIDALRKNVRAKHYHVTFEPLFDDPGTVDLSGINWIVVGNKISALNSRNKNLFFEYLEKLSKLYGFRVCPGFKDRVIYKELFLEGLTVLDMQTDELKRRMSVSHIAAKREIRALAEFICPE